MDDRYGVRAGEFYAGSVVRLCSYSRLAEGPSMALVVSPRPQVGVLIDGAEGHSVDFPQRSLGGWKNRRYKRVSQPTYSGSKIIPEFDTRTWNLSRGMNITIL